MSGAIIIATRDYARHSAFAISLLELEKPPDTQIVWSTGLDVARGLNEALRRVPQAEWAWVLADDHTFAADTLIRLLADNVPVVVPVVSSRHAPYRPVLFSREGQAGHFEVFDWSEIPHEGLFVLAGAGSAGMLIRRSALDAVGDPWFEAGRIRPDETGEDTWLSHKFALAGVPVVADCAVTMTHLTTMTLVPQRTPHGWMVGLQ
jgi:hypothetical protein